MLGAKLLSNKESLLPLKMLLFSYHAANTIIISFLPLYLESKHLNAVEIGWVLAVGPFASIFSQPFWGYMSDKYKTVKKILMICIIGFLSISIVFFQMNSLIAIILMGSLFFFFATPVGALSDSLTQRRATSLGISFGSIRTWGSIGFATSSLLIGALLSKIGVQYMIFPYLIFGTIALIVVFKLTDIQIDQEPIQLKDIRFILGNKSFTIFLLLIMLITTAHRANDSFMALYIADLGGSEFLVGVAWFIGVISEAAIFALAGFWFKKYHPLVFIIFAGILYSIRWFVYGGLEEPLYIISLQVLHGLTFGVFYVSAFDYVTRLIPNILQATGHLIFYAVFFGVSGIIGSLLGGFIFNEFSGEMLYFAMGCLTLFGTICLTVYHLFPFKNKQTTKRPSL